jgi:hypothetical protein
VVVLLGTAGWVAFVYGIGAFMTLVDLLNVRNNALGFFVLWMSFCGVVVIIGTLIMLGVMALRDRLIEH